MSTTTQGSPGRGKDQQLQDYLDDRMTAEEKGAFENILASDPELAERLAEHLQMRDALREEEPLPPGFYTRTRAEFEKRQGSPKRRVFGLLPWEAVGLAAATGLALALFVPTLIRDELPMAPSLGEAAGSRQVAEREREPAANFADDEAIASDTVAGEAVTEGIAGVAPAKSSDEVEKRQPLTRPSVQAEQKKEWRADAPAAGKLATPPTEPSPRTSAGATAEPQQEQVFAPSPPAPADRDESLPEQQRRARPGAARLEQQLGKAIRATPLQAGAVPPYTVRSVESGDARAYVDTSEKTKTDFTEDAAATAPAPAGRGPAEGLVLIGPRDVPFSCSGMRLETLSDQLVVHLAAVGPDRPASPGGCAIYLPNDDRPIVIMDP